MVGQATSEDAGRAILRLLKPEYIDSSSLRTGDGRDKTSYKARMRQFCIKSAVVEGHWHLLKHLEYFED
jgi:hypothetical protein